ncbi:uncharacterized protein TrAtP1_006905 [Trichoderma atroviride]|uniref:uncharacterized protein n=1 Tax=Hypocrea atroviridis TaxID=63577 RepID=UPI00332EB7EC|nr:hypothetical protein TrAtP1_006905 [Trichoderma atroviride]
MHGETVFVRSLILEHPQARSLTAQPSFVTPSMIQLSEQGGKFVDEAGDVWGGGS